MLSTHFSPTKNAAHLSDEMPQSLQLQLQLFVVRLEDLLLHLEAFLLVLQPLPLARVRVAVLPLPPHEAQVLNLVQQFPASDESGM